LEEHPRPETESLIEQVVESQNLRAAYRRVKANAGAPGIDQLTVAELRGHLTERWAD
jgi:RNA-directed DNA polymerase